MTNLDQPNNTDDKNIPIRIVRVVSFTPLEENAKYKITPTPDPDSPTGVYIPANIAEAIVELEKMLTPEFIEEMKESDLNELMGTSHFGLGEWMRYNWGLWHGSRLSEFLKSKGVSHPDNMSSGIIFVFWHYLNDNPRL